MTNVKDVIIKLREVRKEKKLSYDQILSMLETDGEYTSKSTLSRLFGNKWHEYSFDYERTILPIANILLDVDNIEDDDDLDTRAYKSILRLKKDIIQELEKKVEKVESEEKAKYLEKLAEETEKFQRSLDFATHQIALKDKRIDQLMDDNSKLVNHILDCPYRKDCQK